MMLEERLRDHFAEVAESTPVAAPARFTPTTGSVHASATGQRRRWAIPAAVSLAAAAIAVIVVVTRTDDAAQQPPASQPSIPADDPVLWRIAPGPGLEPVYHSTFAKGSFATGALVAPDGTVFGVRVDVASADAPTAGDARQVGAFDVVAVADGTSPETIYRSFVSGCWAVSVTTAGEAAYSDDALAVLEAIAVNGRDVTLTAPAGWTSLGVGDGDEQFQTIVNVSTNGATTGLFLTQTPNAPLGVYLATMESAPQPIDLDGQPGWLVDGVTTEGSHTVISEFEGTAFTLSGVADPQRLIELAATMQRAPAQDWIDGADPGVTPATYATPPAGCENPTLTIS